MSLGLQNARMPGNASIQFHLYPAQHDCSPTLPKTKTVESRSYRNPYP